MSSKKRRSKKKDETPQADDAAATEEVRNDGQKDVPEDVPKDASRKGGSSKKSSLPSFGFTTDLLKKKADDESNGASSVEDLEVDLEAGEVDADSPSRIFDFADRVQRRAREEKDDEGPQARWETWVTFRLDDEIFAMPVDPVRQVVRVTDITRVPHAPEPVRGVTNLRGRVIPVIDLRMRVGLEPSEIGRQSRVVAVASRGRVLGLLVDSVHQVVHLDVNRVQPPPEDVMTVQSDYILGVYHQEDRLILLLDVDRALILREKGAA